jgi:endoglucanase
MNFPATATCRQLTALWCASVLCASTLAGDPPVLPGVINLAPVTPKIVGLTLRDREVRPVARQPYLPQPDDILRPSSATAPSWTPQGIQVVPKFTQLWRECGGEARLVGYLYTPRDEKGVYLWAEEIVGQPLCLYAIDHPEAYTIQSNDDVRYAVPRHPSTVHRKTKPHNGNDITGEKVLDHRLYLVLPHELQEGATYAVSFPGLSRRLDSAAFGHRPSETVTEALHVNQIGYRPDDPFKRAYLSLWMGTGGGLPLDAATFTLIDATTGQAVFTAPITASFPASRDEAFATPRNFVGADVHYLDFHAFRTPGTYRVQVPGLGVSPTFVIAEEDTWARAFHTAMQGFLHHRSGLALGPPLTPYRRPRPMHPADGTRVFTVDVTMLEGEAATIQRALLAQLASGVPPEEWETLPDAWGGYMDAGDWDRRSPHLSASRHLAELFSLRPDFFETFALNLPPDEATDHLPDLLNEVIWNVAFYRRLQTPDGGVRGGVESTEHPRPGETSWEESLVLAAYAPDPYSSYSYAGTAALLARLLTPYDRPEAEAYAASAHRAWDWAETHGARVLDEAEERSADLPADTRRRFRREVAETRVREKRFVAAAELFGLTREATYHAVFRDLFGSSGTDPDVLGALLRYARLPAEQTDPALRLAAIDRIVRLAEHALAFGEGNAFGLHTHAAGLAMMGYNGFYSVPEMVTGPVLPRAHVLTGDERFLRGALHAAHFSAGANPLNQTFTTGVGHHWPQHPLHIDSRVSGQIPPAGLTIYGPMDAAADFPFNAWVHEHHLTAMTPPSRTWPAAEWHVDMFRWPAMSEYTIHQTFRPTAYYWGYLASRP